MCKTKYYPPFIFAPIALVLVGLLPQAACAQAAGRTPEGVIQSLLDLTRQHKIAEAQALWTAESQKKFNFAKVPKEQFVTYQRVMFLLDPTTPTQVQVGQAQTQGEETIVPVLKETTLDQKFVLCQENGQWRIDLIRSAALSPLLPEEAGEQSEQQPDAAPTAGPTPDGVVQELWNLMRARRIAEAQALWTAESQKKYDFTKVPREQFDTYQRVMFLLYMTMLTPCEIGQAQTQGEETTVPVRKMAGLDQKFVLRQENGQWRIDLLQSAARSPLFPEVLRGGESEQRLDDVFERAREMARRATCLSNLKQLLLGILMYAQDYNQVLPPAETWGDAILPYVKNKEIFLCPSAPDLPCGYAYHDAYSKKKLAEVSRPAEAILLYDSTRGDWNAHDAGTSLPKEGRHLGQVNVGYVDGHVKALEAAQAQEAVKR
jgi:prepilin-type processing-associated H-X9-DG protein